MARALTADEQQRYPWASCISDFVPVGRWRKMGVGCVVAGIVVLALGVGFLYLTADNIKHGVEILDRTLGQVSLGLAGILFAVAFVIGVVTSVRALVHNARTPLIWSLGCMAPVFLGVLIALLTNR